jgi:hypothetical protein
MRSGLEDYDTMKITTSEDNFSRVHSISLRRPWYDISRQALIKGFPVENY